MEKKDSAYSHFSSFFTTYQTAEKILMQKFEDANNQLEELRDERENIELKLD